MIEIIFGAGISIYITLVFNRYIAFEKLKSEAMRQSRVMMSLPDIYVPDEDRWRIDTIQTSSDLYYLGHRTAGDLANQNQKEIVDLIISQDKSKFRQIDSAVQSRARNMKPDWFSIFLFKRKK